MGICLSTVVTTDYSNANQTLQMVPAAEVVQNQPTRKKNFDADDNPLPTGGCCVCCIDPGLLDCCCDCDCGDCVLCYWCLNCDCCLECDDCCGQCLSNCI